MTSRRGIFFISKSRPIETNVLIEEKNRSPTNVEPSKILNNDDGNSSASSNSQASPPKPTTTSSAVPGGGVVKKKLILRNNKRMAAKTIYSGPRKIFSTSYKANRAQFNHRSFFGTTADEFEFEATNTTDCNVQAATKKPVLTKSKSTDQLRPTATTTTISENGKTKIVCPRDQKKMYTIVPNIRQPATCEELGETQSHIDDMEYLLTGFQPDKLLSSRCLSVVKFAELCTKPSFRLHLRTESALERALKLLKDAPEIPSLNLCTAFILYVLSSDTLTSGITPSIVRFMIELAKKSPPANTDDEEYKKMKQKILAIIKTSLQEDIFYEQRFNTCDIILETFVNISHNNLKDWLRNEARTSHSFDFKIDAIHSIVQDLSNNDFECYPLSDLLIRYRKVCRFINMLEEFSSDNSEQSGSGMSSTAPVTTSSSSTSSTSNIDINRMYIAQYNQYSLFHSLSKLLDLSLIWFKQHTATTQSEGKQSTATNTTNSKNPQVGDAFRDGCKTIMSILVILTNDCESNCDRLISDDRFFSNLFRLLVLIEQSSLNSEDKFDSLALTLNLLINLVQNSKNVYKHIMEENMPGDSSTKIYEYLARLFCQQESLAAKAESQEENDWMMEEGGDDLDERLGINRNKNNHENGASFNRALQKAAGHMENTFVAAFAGVILAVVLLRDRTTYSSQIRALMPQKKFDTMAFILKKFFVFMHMSHAFTPSGVKILEEIIAMVLSLCG